MNEKTKTALVELFGAIHNTATYFEKKDIAVRAMAMVKLITDVENKGPMFGGGDPFSGIFEGAFGDRTKNSQNTDTDIKYDPNSKWGHTKH